MGQTDLNGAKVFFKEFTSGSNPADVSFEAILKNKLYTSFLCDQEPKCKVDLIPSIDFDFILRTILNYTIYYTIQVFFQ